MTMFRTKAVPAAAGSIDQPHPYIGRAAVFAIVASMLAIVWAKVEVLGTRDIERALGDEDASLTQVCIDRIEAVALNRWATGFSQ
jgi:hypothetical protein